MNFKSIFKKQNILPVAVLLAICIVVAGVLGAVNLLTADRIADNEYQKVMKSITEVVGGEYAVEVEVPENAADTVTGMYKVYDDKDSMKLLGTVATVKVKGYADDILMTVGVKVDGTVSKVIITSQSESHGKAGMSSYPDKFAGLATDKVGGVELFGGATVSSTAIKNGVIDAVNAITGGSVSADPDIGTSSKVDSPKSVDELLILADKLVSGNQGFDDITPEKYKPDTLYRIFKEKSGLGYVAYVVTSRTYEGNTFADNEALIYIDAKGTIKDIDHLTWVVGHDVTKDGFTDRFIGKDLWNIKDVELLSGATGTSSTLKTAIIDALDYVTKQIERTEEKLLELISRTTKTIFGYERVELEKNAPEALKMLFKEKSGDGYVAYLMTYWYGSIATESLLHIDANGCVRNLDILIWSTGHGIGSGDFAENFKGLDLEELKWAFDEKNEDGIDLIAGCTGTSSGLKDAVIAALEYVPATSPAAKIIGLVALFGAFACVAAIITYKSIKRRRAK